VHHRLIDDEKSWRNQAVANLEFAASELHKIERAMMRGGLRRQSKRLAAVSEALALTRYLLVHPMPEAGGDDGDRQAQPLPRLRVVTGGSGSITLPNARPSGNRA
jgi:hypothetical protein